MKTAKKLSFENSVVITNRIAVDLPRVEQALMALAIKTNSPDAARLAGLLSQVVSNWESVTSQVVSEKAIAFRKAELEEQKRKQAAKRGEKFEVSQDDTDGDFDL